MSSCMDEPTYNIFHPKRDIQEPFDLGLEQIDAFQIKLNWQIDMGDNSEFLDGFIGKRFSSITPVENIHEIEFNESFIISLNEIEIDIDNSTQYLLPYNIKEQARNLYWKVK